MVARRTRQCLVGVAGGRGLFAGASVQLEPVPSILQRCEGFKA